MNISTISKNTENNPVFIYKNNVSWHTAYLFIFLGLGILNLVKIIKQGFKLDFYDIFWSVMIVCYVLMLVDYLFSTTSFAISDGRLAIRKRRLFYTKVKSYEISRVENLEVERVSLRRYPLKAKLTDEYIVTFFYDDTEVAVGEYLRKFDAQGLYDAIVTANHQNLDSRT